MSRIVDTIAAGGVQIAPDYADFEEVVGGLVGTLIENGQIAAGLRASALAAVREREQLSSTVMVEIGVSIPHARVEGVAGVVGALAVAKDGVYQAMQGVPIRIVCLVLSSPELAGEHLNTLAGLSLLLQSESTRDRLVATESSEAVIELLRAQSGRRRQ